MSYANGKIYVDGTTTPHVGVSIYDMQQALNTNADDLGTLCKHQNINRWATFKPAPFGGVESIGRDATAPYGLRTCYTRVNPSDGSMKNTGDANTTLSDFINALDTALIGGTSNPFLNDLVMLIKPSGGNTRAYRATDFVTTQSVRGTTPIRGLANIHGYQNNAVVQYGFYDQEGHYYGISNAIGLNSDGDIVCDSDQSIDIAKSDIFGSGEYSARNLDVRIGWGRTIENNLCVLDWIDAMFGMSSMTGIHRGIVIWTNEMVETGYYVAVQTIPWSGQIGSAIKGNANLNWNVVEFFTTAAVNTQSDFMLLSQWNYNSNPNDWMLIPGMIFTNRHIANNDPYAVGAFFKLADVSPYLNKLYVYFRITNLGANSSVRVFISSTPNPNSIYDHVMNTTWSRQISATGDYDLYENENLTVYPSDYSGSTSGGRKFNEIFVVGNIYYLCIWGKQNQSDSSERVIWQQALVATVADSLEIYQ